MTFKRRWIFALRILLFLLLLSGSLILINRVLEPKFLGDSKWPTTLTYERFYQLEKDSIDVLFLGSSHSVSAFSPFGIYEESGIKSYNLASDQQNLLLSYYWLKEALKTQSPKVVMLEPCFAFPYAEDKVLNSKEAYIRKAVDNMRWSENKVRLIHEICKLDDSYEELSFYLTNLRYHSRWKELEKKDFRQKGSTKGCDLNGYAILNGALALEEEYVPFSYGDTTLTAEMIPLMRSYLDLIVELCKEKGIQLVLVRTPIYGYDNAEKSNTLLSYAKKKKIKFLDFNEKSVYEKTKFDLSNDMSDYEHVNYLGAQKITKMTAKALKSLIPKEERKAGDAVWDQKIEVYHKKIENMLLKTIWDPFAYLRYLSEHSYMVFIVAKNEASEMFTDGFQEAFSSLGIRANLEGKYQWSYLALLGEEENTLEVLSPEFLSREGRLADGSAYSVISSGYNCGNRCSVVIDREEYAINTRGLNIVVYDPVTKEVVDSVVIDTGVTMALTRAEES